MFKRKCPKCSKKIEKKYDFCPFCGKDLKSEYDNDDFGFFGKNDFIEDSFSDMPGGSFIDKMMNSAIKMIEKQMRDFPRDIENQQSGFSNFPKSNMMIKLMVNGKEIPINRVNKELEEKPKKIQPKISEEKVKKLAKLPRKEPKTTMKRLSNKLIYELSVPGVEDVEDVLVNQLENSIEIKAIAEDKVYSKTLNINLPILKYMLAKGILILELKVK